MSVSRRGQNRRARKQEEEKGEKGNLRAKNPPPPAFSCTVFFLLRTARRPWRTHRGERAGGAVGAARRDGRAREKRSAKRTRRELEPHSLISLGSHSLPLPLPLSLFSLLPLSLTPALSFFPRTAYQDEGDEMLAARDQDDNIPVDDEEDEGEELFGDGMERCVRACAALALLCSAASPSLLSAVHQCRSASASAAAALAPRAASALQGRVPPVSAARLRCRLARFLPHLRVRPLSPPLVFRCFIAVHPAVRAGSMRYRVAVVPRSPLA